MTPASRRHRRRTVVVAATLLATYAFFYQAGGWNQNSRYDLVRAVVEHHTFAIDAYHLNTGDKALVGDHYYSDKAPGLALLAIVPVAVLRPVIAAVGMDPSGPTALTLLTYLVTLLCVGVPTVLAAVGIDRLARRLGATAAGATFAALVFGLATPMWAYATLFWGHALCAAVLFGGFAAAVCLRDRAGPRRDLVLGGLVGLAVGWAVVSEFTAAPPALLVCILAAVHATGNRVRVALAMFAGALLCGLVLMGHNVAAFGSAFEFGYTHTVNFPQMKQGLFGISAPQWDVLWAILFGEYRGLLYAAPVLAAAPIGLYLLARTRGLTAGLIWPVTVAAVIPVYYLVVNAGYATWDGGASYGPRFRSCACRWRGCGTAGGCPAGWSSPCSRRGVWCSRSSRSRPPRRRPTTTSSRSAGCCGRRSGTAGCR